MMSKDLTFRSGNSSIEDELLCVSASAKTKRKQYRSSIRRHGRRRAPSSLLDSESDCPAVNVTAGGSIDLKDWPSHLPLPFQKETHSSTTNEDVPHTEDISAIVSPSLEWRTLWETSLNESIASTDVGFTTSTYSGLNWDYDDRTLLSSGSDEGKISGGSDNFFGSTTSRSHQMVCGDRLTPWRREESSPLFFFLALIIVCTCASFYSPTLTAAPASAPAAPLPFTTATQPAELYLHKQTSSSSSHQRQKSTLLFPSYDLPMSFEIQSPSKFEPRWRTFGVTRRRDDALRLTVFSVGAAVTIYAYRWF